MKILDWALSSKTNKIISLSVVVIILFLALGAYSGVSDWFQKRAEIKELKQSIEDKKKDGQQASEAWQSVFSAKEAEKKKITRERDSLRKEISDLHAEHNKPWIIPATDNETLSRFRVLGY